MAERRGRLSATTDTLSNTFPYIKDPLNLGTWLGTNQTACFNDGGRSARFPRTGSPQTGPQILKLYPLPNHTVLVRRVTTTIIRPVEARLAGSRQCAWTISRGPTLRAR